MKNSRLYKVQIPLSAEVLEKNWQDAAVSTQKSKNTCMRTQYLQKGATQPYKLEARVY
jgi:hypothetical protein